jgi:hypothetical protein
MLASPSGHPFLLSIQDRQRICIKLTRNTNAFNLYGLTRASFSFLRGMLVGSPLEVSALPPEEVREKLAAEAIVSAQRPRTPLQ